MHLAQSNLLEVLPDASTTDQSVLADTKISPILKWPGGKTGELSMILPAIPSRVARYFEPFLGGGAVFWSISRRIPALVNDVSIDLISLYRSIAVGDTNYFGMLENFRLVWQAIESLVENNQAVLIMIYKRNKASPNKQSRLRADVLDFVQQNNREVTGLLVNCLSYDSGVFISEVIRNLTSKLIRTYKIEIEQGLSSDKDILDNIESAIKSAFYMYLRHLYNYHERYKIDSGSRSAIFFFVREYAYASMFRFNNDGHFNVPYGGISYNRKDIASKILAMKASAIKERLQMTLLENMDFLDFLRKYQPMEDDFVFLDPPYDSDFSNYDKNHFNKDDHFRLADYLTNHCRGRFMLVIKSTDYILSLYEGKSLNIKLFDKKYMWTIKERNNRDTVHLMITNYQTE